MEGFLNYQGNIATRIEKSYDNYKKSPKKRITISYLQNRLDILQESWAQFVAGHQNLMIKFSPESLAATDYMEKDVYDATEELYIDYKSDLMEKLETLKQNPVKNENSDNDFNVKLPEISIPNFSGKYTEWLTFRDLFLSMVDNNKKLQNVQKLHYLKSFISGEAEQLLRNISITNDNYQKCWELLKSRYDNKKYLSNCILKRLLSQKTASVESASFLKEMIDTSTDCLNALSNIGVNVTTWDIIVVHILTLKLDGETRKQWELYVANSLKSDELPTFDQFKEFITNRFRALEFVDQRSFNKPLPTSSAVNRFRSMHIAGGSDEQSSPCTFCSGDHKLHSCSQFANLESDARREFVQRTINVKLIIKLHKTFLVGRSIDQSSGTKGNPINLWKVLIIPSALIEVRLGHPTEPCILLVKRENPRSTRFLVEYPKMYCLHQNKIRTTSTYISVTRPAGSSNKSQLWTSGHYQQTS
ncbi:hypothetical protein NE865_00692 [Phthorimaea operculella]|nr:hypothetical protein NE865_00692 [Phthorimaea operculella]